MMSSTPTIFMAMAMVTASITMNTARPAAAVDAFGGGQLLVHRKAHQRLPQPSDDRQHRGRRR